jgi:ubiquinone/menaquinone biosynthesis C-methylase UbiE
MTDTTHFDRRAPTYDTDETHQRIATLFLAPFTFTPGEHILDLATGTGLIALQVAKHLAGTGQVIGLDHSPNMLATAAKSAEQAELINTRFDLGDAQDPPYQPNSFDRIFCASALVLLSGPAAALRCWRPLLKPHGMIAFDTPAKPFGFSERAAAAGRRHGINLPYDTIADTEEKCRALLAQAQLQPVSIRKTLVATSKITPEAALALYDERMDHPAWRPIAQSAPEIRAAIRADYIASIAADGSLDNEVALLFTTAKSAR